MITLAQQRVDSAAPPASATPRTPCHRAHRTHTHMGRADDPMMLLHLILRGVRQRGLVILNPYVIPRIDPTVARLASEKMFGLGDGPPIGRSPSNDPRGLGSSICMTVVISTSQKIRPRNCFQGLIRTAGVHPPAPPSQFILSQQSPLSNCGSDLLVQEFSFADAIGGSGGRLKKRTRRRASADGNAEPDQALPRCKKFRVAV